MNTIKKEVDPLFTRKAATREELMALGREINARAGVPVPPPMTREELNAAVEALHVSQLTHGVKPEDNGGSRELMRMRYGDEWTEEDWEN